MKHTFYLLLLLFLLPCFACGEDDWIKELSNESLLRSTTIDAGKTHIAFPTIVGNEDNSKILVAYREGSAHISYDSELVQMESSDKGVTWTNRKVIYTPEEGCDVRDPQYFRLTNGDIICRFFVKMSESEAVVKCIKSTDDGKTYSEAVDMPAPKSEVFAASRGNMVMVDDIIYSINRNRWSVAWIVTSKDNGESWQYASWLDERLWTNQLDCDRINETSLGYVNGTLYAVGRQAPIYSDGDERLEVGVSEDMGENWEWKHLSVWGHAPSLTSYGDSFILTYRDTEDESKGKYSFNIGLMRNGALVKTPVALFESSTRDIGYGDVLTLENSFLVCCYQPNKILCYELSYDLFD